MSLDKTIKEVRYAYRLLWEFQKRTLDTVRLISDQFNDRLFYQWSNYKATLGTRTGTAPFNFPPRVFSSFVWRILPLCISGAGESSASSRELDA